MATKIPYADVVWNPVTGCTKVSQGCKHCYAERIANRKLPKGGFSSRPFTEVRAHPERLFIPLHWRKPRVVFVNSMGDLFHEDVPDGFIDRVFVVMAASPQHTFLVFSKRGERRQSYCSTPFRPTTIAALCNFELALQASHPDSPRLLGKYKRQGFVPWPLPNVVQIVSVEDQETLDERVPILRQTPAAMRGVSLEPQIGDVGAPNLDGISWLVQGCESGPQKRLWDWGWARSVRDQCVAARVPYYFKQATVNGKVVLLPELDGKTWEQTPWWRP
ncbi:MAG: hypothetical protein A2Y38_18175 [Spirochaetes bacterium GWB1_59_5]|nr:MAG: hypothetical protein A2Y38_18175 [Spirochaetes bacterium GWB1_59_5]